MSFSFPLKILSVLLLGLIGCTRLDRNCAACEATKNPLYMLLYMPRANFVATGAYCSIWRSYNGKSWVYSATDLPGCTAGSVNGITFGDGKFVAVGSATGSDCGIWVGTGEESITWTRATCPVTKPLVNVAFGGHEFAAVGSAVGAASYEAVSSFDATTWTNRTYADGGAAAFVLRGVIYSPSAQQFFLGTAGTQGIRSRPIGGSWGAIVNTLGIVPGNVALGPRQSNGNYRMFAMYDSGGQTVQYSDDNWQNWNNMSPNPFNGAGANTLDAVFAGDRGVFVRSNCGVNYSVSSSADNTVSFVISSSVCFGASLNAIAYGDGYFVAGGSTGQFFYSPTGFVQDWQVGDFPSVSNPVHVKDLVYRPPAGIGN